MKRSLIRTAVAFFVSFSMSSAHGAVIYQAFEESFVKIEQKLDRLRDLGYTYIQVSPPQKSINRPEWWARYQPLDHSVIEGPLGTETELKQLITASHKRGLKVLIDTILNHMADPYPNPLVFNEFSPNDFHFPENFPDRLLCIQDYNDRYQVTHYWLCSDTKDRGLPDLDTSSPKVREVLGRYLEKLIDLGADGFRFDAMKHVEPEYWAYQTAKLRNRGLYFYGEVIGQTLEESYLYAPFADITDFHLLSLMTNTFALGGDLRNLYDPVGTNKALRGQTVLFARNHDTVMHPKFFSFGDYTDAMLANAYILGRGLGNVTIYRDDFEHPLVTNALKFRNMTNGLNSQPLAIEQVCQPSDNCSPKTLMFIKRGNSGLMILNISNNAIELPRAKFSSLEPGCYQSIKGSSKLNLVEAQGGERFAEAPTTDQQIAIRVEPRSASYYVKSSDQRCI